MKIYRVKDVPWRMKCRRMVEHVYSVFCFGSENWSLSHATLDRMKSRETKAMYRLLRFNREKDETWTDSCTRTCRIARKMWVKMNLLFI